VFLSRTSEFAEYPSSYSYVDAAMDACNREKFSCDDMSHWTAVSAPAAATCRERVGECGIYVGVVGFNYGSPVRDEPDRSYVELELEEACRLGMPVYLFLLADDGDMLPRLVRGNVAFAAAQEAFRQRLLDDDRFTVAQFRNPDQLKDLIGRALRDEQPRRVPFMAREPEDGLVGRPAELDEIVSRIRAAAARTTGADDVGLQVVGIQGTGGFGKTTLATLACHEVRQDFPGGVLWVTLGDELTEHQLIGKFQELLFSLGDEVRTFPSASAAGAHLADVLGNRRALLVLDDVWRRDDLDLFLRGATATVRLVTTRDRGAFRPPMEPVCVDQLSVSQTRQLLARGLPDRGVDWSELDRRTGRWPLLVDLVNTTLQDEVHDGRPLGEAVDELARRLARRGPSSLDTELQGDRRSAVAATVEESVARLQRRLGQQAAERYRDLAVFPEGVAATMGVLATWWGVEPEDVRSWERAVRRLSLVQTYDAGTGSVRLHDVLREYLRSTRSDAEWHERQRSLLAAHRPASGRWADLPEDAEHLWRWIAFHLQQADLDDELLKTFRDVGFLARAVHRLGTWAVRDQLAFSDSPVSARLRSWLRRWANLVERLPAVVDVAATLMARPEAPDLLTVALTDAPGPLLRYAEGWPCPEPAGSALDSVVGRHHRRVQSVAWSPDGDRVASGDGNGLLRVWDVDRDKPPVKMASGHWVRAVAWSPDGGRLVCGSDDGAVALWHVGARDEERVLLGEHHVGVRVVAWSPDGSRIASASDDGVRVWSSDGSRQPVRPRPEPLGQEPCDDDWVRSLAWSPDGGRLAYGDDGGQLWVWPVEDGAPTLLAKHRSPVLAVAWARDGTVASGAEDGTLLLQRPDSDGAMFALPSSSSAVLALSWSPDGHRLASGSADGALRVWSGEGGTPEAELGGHDGGVLAVAWSGTGNRLVSGGCDGALRLWRVDSAAGGLELRRDEDRIRAVAWSRDSGRLATSGGDGGVRVWQAEHRAASFLVGQHDGEARGVAWATDGGVLASGGDDRVVRLWFPGGCGQPRQELAAPGQCVRALAWSPAGGHLACVGGDGSIQLWRLGSGSTATPLARRGEWVRSVAWSPDGSGLVSGGDDHVVRLWDLDGDGSTRLGRHDCGVSAVTWLASGRHVLSGDDHGELRLWDIEDGGHVRVGRHELGVRAVAGSPDGLVVASVGGDSAVRIWQLEAEADTSDPTCTLALTGTLHALAWRPAGARLAVAGVNGLYVLELGSAAGCPDG
jgi:WD40 repeat protein